MAAIPLDERFPSLEAISTKRGTSAMPKPAEAGKLIADAISRLPELVESGAYADVRKPPITSV